MNTKVVREIFRSQPKTFIFIAVLLFSTLCLCLYTIGYQMPQVQRLQGTWFQKRNALSGRGALDISAEYRKGIDDLKTWRARILPKKEFAGFISRLFDTARDNSLSIKAISYKSNELSNEGLAAYTVNFNVSGKYAAIKSFISDMQRVREMITVDNIGLSNSKTSEDKISLKIQMTVYLRVGEQ